MRPAAAALLLVAAMPHAAAAHTADAAAAGWPARTALVLGLLVAAVLSPSATPATSQPTSTL